MDAPGQSLETKTHESKAGRLLKPDQSTFARAGTAASTPVSRPPRGSRRSMTSFRQAEANRATPTKAPVQLLKKAPPRPHCRDGDQWAKGCGRLQSIRSCHHR